MLLAPWAIPLWRWFQRRQASRWPTVTCRIESVAVKPKKQFLISASARGRAPAYAAELAYSYTLEGRYHSGYYQREFGSEEGGWEFVRDLQGKSVLVFYYSRKVGKSLLSEDAVSALLSARQERPPIPVRLA